MRGQDRFAVMGFVLLVAAAWLGPARAGVAQSGEEAEAVERVAPDTAVLELDLPAGATSTINGVPQGSLRRIVLRPFTPGAIGRYEVRVRFGGGREASARTVLLQGGWRVRLRVEEPGAVRPELVLQGGHAGSVDSVAFGLEGRHVLTGSADGMAILWDAQTGRRLRTLEGHANAITSVAFSPDGRRALTGSSDQTAILWDVETGRKLRVLKGHTNWVTSVAFDHEGRRVLTQSSDTEAVVWDADTGRRLTTPGGDPPRFNWVVLSPDGRRALIRSYVGAATVWDVDANRELATLGQGVASDAAFGSDGRHILTSSGSAAILWDAQTGRKLRTLEGHSDTVRLVALSPDGRLALTGSDDRTAVIWDVETGRKVRTLDGHDDGFKSVEFSRDGRRALTRSYRRAIVWEVETGRRLSNYNGGGRTGLVTSVALSPDGRRVVTGSDYGKVVVSDVESGRQLIALGAATSHTTSVAFSPDGLLALAGSADGRANVWDVRAGRKVRTLDGHDGQDVSSVAFGPDAQHALTGSHDGRAIVWDAETGRKRLILEGNGGRYVVSIAYSLDGRRALAGLSNGTALVWDARNGQKVRVLEVGGSWVDSVALSPDGRRALTPWGNSAIVWDLESGRKLMTFQGHTKSVESVVFSPDGRRALTGASDRTAVVWDMRSGRKLITVRVHASRVDGAASVAFSADGRWIVTASFHGRPTIWDAESGRELTTLGGAASSSVTSVSLSPDGRRALTGSWDGTIRLWDLATGDELARLISLDKGQDWLVVTPEGLFDGSEGGRKKVCYRVGDGLNVVPVDRYFRDFFRPGLLAELLAGERPTPEADFGKKRPPKVRFVAPAQGGKAEENPVEVVLEAVDDGGGVEGPTLHHNGVEVHAAGEPERLNKVVRVRMEVALIQGENRLEVRAASEDGSWESEPAALTLTYEKPLEKPELYVLAVGVSRYAQADLDLKYPDDDARAIASLFRRRGGALYRAVHVVELIDGEATKEGIRKALVEGFARKARPQDTLLVFLSGHGTTVGERYYFIPHEFKDRPGHRAEEDVADGGLPGDVLTRDYMVHVRALKKLLVLDTCGSGSAVGLGARGKGGNAFRGAIERLVRAQGVYTIAAAPADAEAQEPDELGHGVLSYALLAGLGAVDSGPLKGQAMSPKDPGRVADVQEWFVYAGERVPELMRRYYGREQDAKYEVGGRLPILPVEDR